MLDRLAILFAARPSTAEAWLARMGRPGVSARDQAAFGAWLDADPDHLRQYETLKAANAELAGLRQAFEGDLTRLRRGPARRGASRGLVLGGGFAAVAAVVAVIALLPMLRASHEGQLFESAPGQIVDLMLDDGSKVTLDADSAIRVALAPDVRRLTLERGSAYFEVEHDGAHPFQVAVADRRVIVTGTRFVTAITGDSAQISVLQGRVAIGRRDAARADALDGAVGVTAGERAVFQPGAAQIVKTRADVDAATAWRQRRLVFRNVPMSEVIAAAARYSDAPLVVADPALQRLYITTVLPLEGDGALADRMAALLPISAEHAADGRILIRAE
ncbi:FecR domain-containing protein [Phenylobacterium sp.]|uniref:FecR family protein n=1 Tax=Phenylobacterium sp. TaxID=1871053 RepID=UPI0027309600|nr:FecR domain-containing protein [Phenylobacterium sp.]MDP1619271.1 FecR domain-containing protein [Phenylobacterium sp.]MDP1986373.1 FecR domain-containing protein [Phenylobacterium sp.]